MLGWLIYEEKAAQYNQAYIDWYVEEGKKLGITFRLLYVEKMDIGVNQYNLTLHYEGQELTAPDFAICRVMHPLLSEHLERMGIRLFNNHVVSEYCNNKAKTYLYLANQQIPMIPSTFVRYESLPQYFDEIKEYSVIKAVSGHGGQQVCLYSPDHTKEVKEEQQKEILDTMQHQDVVVQPIIGHKHQDLRVYVIGKEIVAAVLRTAKHGFRSNFSLGGEVSEYILNETERKLVQRIVDAFDFGLVGIDFLIQDDGSLIFNEIEDVVGARMLCKVTDINIVNRYLLFIMEKIK